MRALTFILFFSCNIALAAPCLDYVHNVTVQGVLARHTFPEQPNYESIAAGDAPATYFFVTPPKPFCVAIGKRDDEPAVARVDTVQLVFMGKVDGYGPLRPYLGKAVTCSGMLFAAISGHHHSPVLLSVEACKPAP